MGQGDILRILEHEPERWFTNRELAMKTDVTPDTVNRVMRKMRRFKEVEWARMVKNGRPIYHYRWNG